MDRDSTWQVLVGKPCSTIAGWVGVVSTERLTPGLPCSWPEAVVEGTEPHTGASGPQDSSQEGGCASQRGYLGFRGQHQVLGWFLFGSALALIAPGPG